MSSRHISVGEKAPDFILKNQNKQDISLSSLKGKRVLLSFHPLAWTAVCAKQMKSLDRKSEVFEKLNTVALGISIDHVPSKYSWAKELAVTETSLLCDFWPHGAVAKQYGLFSEEGGTSMRANVIVDENGFAAFVKIYPVPELPDIDEIIDFLRD